MIHDGDNGHWRVVDGVIDYDALSEADGDKNLWSEKEYGDFILRLDWRIPETPYINHNARIILPDGTHKKNENGEDILISVPDSDSGIYLRGMSKAQINIRSEEHTSELQSRGHLVCRLLLEKKNRLDDHTHI